MSVLPRYINAIWTSNSGVELSNAVVLRYFETVLKRLPLSVADFESLRDRIRFYLVGERTRFGVPGWDTLTDFRMRALLYETEAEKALGNLADQIRALPAMKHVIFDAIVATTATGHLMPGLSYRMASRLAECLKPDAMLLDLGGVGCTGGVKALNLARALDDGLDNLLIVSVELPTTLFRSDTIEPDVWQGNCTFGDGAMALWVSTRAENGTMALCLSDLRYTFEVGRGLDLIRWGYEDYYTFRLADEKTFENSVLDRMTNALEQAEPVWRDTPHWAIHPAAIPLMLRLSRKLGLDRETLGPSAEHYQRYSNMSSASIFYILKDIAAMVPEQTPINLLTMGAGFNVLYGQVVKER
ncbi:MAG: hypothetical protein FJY97_09965 [candidate division Zixibacteria bacterium]|nr:hypothetical protein [candidate division Zixibacteria bacterium]